MTDTLIVAYERTPQGADAVALGGLLARLLGLRPLVATVFPWPAGIGPEALETAMSKGTKSHFREPLEELAQLDPSSRAIVDQSVSLGLLELAEDEQAEMMVVGSSHRGALGRALLGSTARSVAHGVGCPVAVAPAGFAGRGEDSLNDVAVAFDGSAESRLALAAAVDLASRASAAITLVAVADYPRYGYAAEWTVLSAGEFEDAETRDKERLLADAVAELPDEVEARTRLLHGSPGHELAAASADYDLLLVGSRGFGPVRRVVLGSTSGHLTAASACPVLVLPRGVEQDEAG